MTASKAITTKPFMGFDFDALNMMAAIDWTEGRAQGTGFSYIVTPNVDHVVQRHNRADAAIDRAYDDADLCLCDSRILARLANMSGVHLPLVPGSDLTRDLLTRTSRNWKLAVIGGDPRLHGDLKARYPQFEWLFHEPPMGVLRNAEARGAIAQFVEESVADIVLFAIGAPQSEICCHEIARTGRARGVALCIGASLEFLVGAKKRAPGWMQRAGLEWLFRLASEPKRLWRRYLVVGPRIFPLWWRWHREHRSGKG